jgi:hypothetical protein
MAGLIVQYRRQYNESKNGQKGAIVEEILGILSTDGGRFLRRYNEDSTWWTEVPQQVAFKKVCDAFRSQGKITKAETERRIAEKEKIQDDKRAKKAEVVAERKEKKSKRAEEKEQKVSQCNTHYCSECLCIICIILQSVLYSNPYYIIFFCFYCCCSYSFQETRSRGLEGIGQRNKTKQGRHHTFHW